MPSWIQIAELASWLLSLAKELAVRDGLDPAEFDRRVSELEIKRAASIGSVLTRLQALIGRA